MVGKISTKTKILVALLGLVLYAIRGNKAKPLSKPELVELTAE